MIYFITPKQPTNLQANLQANLRIAQLVKRLAVNRKVMGSLPANTTCFFGFLFLFPKKKVRACFFAARINQPTCYYI